MSQICFKLFNPSEKQASEILDNQFRRQIFLGCQTFIFSMAILEVIAQIKIHKLTMSSFANYHQMQVA
jgi:hypothetical protein